MSRRSRILSVIYVAWAAFGLCSWAVCRQPECVEGTLGVALLYAPQVLWTVLGVLMLAIALVRRAGSDSLCAGVVLVLLLFGLAGLQIHRRPPVEGNVLRAVTLNANSAFANPERRARWLQDTPADIFLLQEVWGEAAYQSCVRANPQLHWFRQLHSPDGHELAIATRLPGAVQLQMEHRGLPMMAIEIPLGSRVLTVVDLHLRKSPERRLGIPTFRGTDLFQRQEVDAGMAPFEAPGRTVLIGGDFNSTGNAPVYKSLRRTFVDCLGTVGRGFCYSFPARFPVWRIDEFLVSPDFRPLRCFVLPDCGSDHRPLYLEVGW